MTEGDFFASEKSHIFPEDGSVRIELVQGDKVTVLKDNLALQKGEVCICGGICLGILGYR